MKALIGALLLTTSSFATTLHYKSVTGAAPVYDVYIDEMEGRKVSALVIDSTYPSEYSRLNTVYGSSSISFFGLDAGQNDRFKIVADVDENNKILEEQLTLLVFTDSGDAGKYHKVEMDLLH